MTTARQVLARRIFNETVRLENTGAHAAQWIGTSARVAAIRAVRANRSPIVAIRHALQTVGPLLRDGMVAAHLAGRQRTILTAAPQFRAREKLKLSAAYGDAIDYLQTQMSLSPSDVERLQATYNAAALNLTGQAGAALEAEVQKTLVETTQSGMGVREGVKALRSAFDKAGFTQAKGHTLEAIFRTGTQTAYGAGRWSSLQDEAVADLIWGYEYNTVGDDRVRPAHEKMDGVKAPKDDPLWQIWWPPAGWNCRCSTLEVFADETAAEPTPQPDVQPDAGFANNPGVIYQTELKPIRPLQLPVPAKPEPLRPAAEQPEPVRAAPDPTPAPVLAKRPVETITINSRPAASGASRAIPQAAKGTTASPTETAKAEARREIGRLQTQLTKARATAEASESQAERLSNIGDSSGAIEKRKQADDARADAADILATAVAYAPLFNDDEWALILLALLRSGRKKVTV